MSQAIDSNDVSKTEHPRIYYRGPKFGRGEMEVSKAIANEIGERWDIIITIGPYRGYNLEYHLYPDNDLLHLDFYSVRPVGGYDLKKASTSSIGFLVNLLKMPVVVPAVRDEIEQGAELGHEYLSRAVEAFDEGLPVSDIPPDIAEENLRKRLDHGEAEALRGTADHDGTIATDDLAARRLATELNIPVTGSIGLLVLGIERGRIDTETADKWIETWRKERGYYAPVESVTELL